MKRNGKTAREDQDELMSLLRRLLKLPMAQQLRAHRILSEALGGRLGKETERARQARQRGEAIEAMREASSHLGLATGAAPNVQEFKRAASDGVLSMGFRAAYAAFDNSWELATRAYEELPIPRTAAQRAIARQVSPGGGGGRNFHEPLVGLRMWLDESPRDASLIPSGYHDWAIETNERRADGSRRVIETPDSVSSRLQVSWRYAVAIARGEMTQDEARTVYVDELLAESDRLVEIERVRAVLGALVEADDLEQPGFPKPLMWFRGELRWSKEDLLAYQKGKRYFGRDKGVAGDRFLGSEETAKILEMHPRTLEKKLREDPPDYLQVPPPSGVTGGSQYWERTDLELWIAEREDRKMKRLAPLIGLGHPLRNRRRRQWKRPKG